MRVRRVETSLGHGAQIGIAECDANATKLAIGGQVLRLVGQSVASSRVGFFAVSSATPQRQETRMTFDKVRKSDNLINCFMKKTSITVTEAARNIADCVNKARYQQVTFVL
jgi:hypothetical protein